MLGYQSYIKQRRSSLHSIKEIQIKCNKQFVVNFDGDELSSDGGLLMIKEFLHALGLEKLLTELPKHGEDADREFLKDLLPWSKIVHEKCSNRKKLNSAFNVPIYEIASKMAVSFCLGTHG